MIPSSYNENPRKSPFEMIYTGLSRYELLEIRTKLQASYSQLIAGNTVEAVTISGQTTSIKVLGLDQIKRELTNVNAALANLPANQKKEGDPAAGVAVRRFRRDFSSTTIC